jgi:hypothetical protein
VHVLMVLVSGPLNQLRGMLTGRYRVSPEPATLCGEEST